MIELAVALGIAGTLLMLGLPAYRAWIADVEMRDCIQALVEHMSFARAEAIRRQTRVNLCPSADRVTCAPGGRWEGGWLIFADDNHDGDRDASEAIVRIETAARPGITIAANRPLADYVSYTSSGHTRMANGALQMGTFTVCRSGSNAVDVVLANGGRVRVNRTTSPCP